MYVYEILAEYYQSIVHHHDRLRVECVIWSCMESRKKKRFMSDKTYESDCVQQKLKKKMSLRVTLSIQSITA